MDRRPLNERDAAIDTGTPIIPEIIADKVAREWIDKLSIKNVESLQKLSNALVIKAKRLYKTDAHFKSKITKGNGREHLAMFMNNWAPSLVKQLRLDIMQTNESKKTKALISLLEKYTGKKVSLQENMEDITGNLIGAFEVSAFGDAGLQDDSYGSYLASGTLFVSRKVKKKELIQELVWFIAQGSDEVGVDDYEIPTGGDAKPIKFKQSGNNVTYINVSGETVTAQFVEVEQGKGIYIDANSIAVDVDEDKEEEEEEEI
jgi:hypothetical protein